jgi:hypothetical protein
MSIKWLGVKCLQERGAGMFLEQIDPSHVAAQRVEALVPADLGQLEHRRARLGGTGQAAVAQAVVDFAGSFFPRRPDRGLPRC